MLMHMNCPKCQEKLVAEPYRLRDYLLCFYCEGAWLSREDILAHGLISTFTVPSESSPHLCPKCMPSTNLAVISVQGCTLEYCKSCEGIFFDKGELEQFSANYKDLDGKSLAKDGAEGLLTLMAIARMVSSLFRFMSR